MRLAMIGITAILLAGDASARLYEVTASTLNVRSGPSKSRAVVARLGKRRAINVVENKWDWKRIDWPKKGWRRNSPSQAIVSTT